MTDKPAHDDKRGELKLLLRTEGWHLGDPLIEKIHALFTRSHALPIASYGPNATEYKGKVAECYKAASHVEPLSHTDHPLRHFDRTCDACVSEEVLTVLRDAGFHDAADHLLGKRLRVAAPSHARQCDYPKCGDQNDRCGRWPECQTTPSTSAPIALPVHYGIRWSKEVKWFFDANDREIPADKIVAALNGVAVSATACSADHVSVPLSELEELSLMAAFSTADPTIEELESILDGIGNKVERLIPNNRADGGKQT